MIAPGIQSPDWDGEHAFGEGWFAFRGQVADNAVHAHAAMQLTVGRQSAIELMDGEGLLYRGRGLRVVPEETHQLMPGADAVLVLIDPAMAIDFGCDAPIDDLPQTVISALLVDGPLRSVVEAALSLDTAAAGDERLRAALDALSASDERTIAELASGVGLSGARLRALAKRELGVPLTKVAGHRRLVRAAEAIAGGASLAEAAAVAGFADQAHLTRVFKATIGLTPGKAARPLR